MSIDSVISVTLWVPGCGHWSLILGCHFFLKIWKPG